MKITYISLVGYKRFMLSGTERFSMKIESALQLIIGLNGSGKSSLVWELSPLPAEKSDFTKTGSKEIRIEHNSVNYTLSSNFGNKHVHSFLIGEEEKNPGGTVSVQRELVKEYFGITNEILELLQGKETFVGLDASQKKAWFLRLSDTNYDYAIRIYNKLREKQRDISGAIKLAKRTLVAESEKLLQDRELEALAVETKELHEALNHLLEYRKPIEHDLDKLSFQQDKFNKILFELSNNLHDTKERLEGFDHSEADYAIELENLEKELIGLSVLNSNATQVYQDNAIKINILQKAQAKTVEQLHNDAQSLYNAIQASISSSLIHRVHPDPIGALSSFNALQPALLDIASEIPLNVDKKYSQEAYLLAKEKLVVLTAAKEAVLFRQSKCRAQLDHLEKHKESPTLECPKCDHRFSPHYSEEKYLVTKAELLKYTEELETVCYPAITECEQYIETASLYSRSYREFVRICTNSPSLSEYWNILIDKKIYTDNPNSAIHELNAIRSDLEMQVLVSNQTKKLADLEETIKSLESVGSGDLPGLLQANSEIEERIGNYTGQIRNGQYRKTILTNTLKTYSDVKNLLKQIRNTIQSKRNVNKEELETIRRQTLNTLIRDLQSLLATKEHTYGMASKQKGIVDRLANEIEQYGIEETAIGHLVRELSPTEGLIAEGLLGFIKNYCDEMNNIIAKIWSYELKVLSCEAIDSETVDLDYKFGMKVENVADPIKDVKFGSTGMVEIINLAFRLVAMNYLGLQDSPLYIDEFAASFDAKHKSASVYMIKSLIEQSTFSQIFMISHDYAQYGALSNAQICALSTTNIVVPVKYNEHVKMS